MVHARRRARRRAAGAAAILAAIVVVALGVPGARATQLAGLKLVPDSGPAGSTVRVTGTWFAGPVAEDGPTRVELRWGGAPDAPLLGTASPDSGGTFITTVRIPQDASEGPHVMVATQAVPVADGLAPAPGTPARKAFTVGEPPVAERATAPPVGAGAQPAPLWLVAAGLAGAMAAATGAVLLVREAAPLSGGRTAGAVTQPRHGRNG